MKKSTKIFIAILIVVLILGIAGGLLYAFRADIFTPPHGVGPSSGIVLKHDDKVIDKPLDAIANGSKYRVDVESDELFSVEILPCDVEFEFRHDGTLTVFPYLNVDWNELFDVKLQKGYFTFDNSSRVIIDDILAKLYPDEEIQILGNIDKDTVYFQIIVTAGEQTATIDLVGWQKSMININLNTDKVVF